MNFLHSNRVQNLQDRLQGFMSDHVYPAEAAMNRWKREAGNLWTTPPIIQELKEKAQAEELWNLFLPKSDDPKAPGEPEPLANLEYAPLAEIMGRVLWAPEVFNCNAPDTGNMETLVRYGSPAQKADWLQPLLTGEIRSGFAMTEPHNASSDATNIDCSIVRQGDEYVINGRKWFTTGAMRDNCRLLIVMGKTDPECPDRHRQQSMILVPRDTPGVHILRSVTTFGYHDAPFGEPEIAFQDVRVPVGNLLLGEGRGFEIAQARLGPGRIHHCMRLVGCAQRSLELACRRVEVRATFGRSLSQHQSVRESIAQAYCEIEQARLLTLMAADYMDRFGSRAARSLIAAIKIVAPAMACRVIDQAMQMHGAAGLTEDFFMAEAYNYARQIRLADGPDEVHMMQLGRDLIRRYAGTERE